jgi:uncharacterized protein
MSIFTKFLEMEEKILTLEARNRELKKHNDHLYNQVLFVNSDCEQYKKRIETLLESRKELANDHDCLQHSYYLALGELEKIKRGGEIDERN